jgi:tetratricopeptide (TPR) repeat protein
MASLKEATQGRKLHNRLTELNPKMVDAQLMQGTHDYVVGSLPWYYKALGFLAGYRGDREAGIATLKRVSIYGDKNRSDAAILLAAIYRRERRAQDAVPLLKDLIGRYRRNYLLKLELVQMYGDLGRRAEALAVLEEVERSKLTLAEKVWLHRGTIEFWFRNFPQAIDNLTLVVESKIVLDPNTLMLAWLRLGQAYDMSQQREQAKRAYSAAVRIAPDSWQGREAAEYLQSPYRRRK